MHDPLRLENSFLTFIRSMERVACGEIVWGCGDLESVLIWRSCISRPMLLPQIHFFLQLRLNQFG
jgi:hypothetical protein